MSLTLDDYQLDAIKRCKRGCILCGGVGSGKSITSLGYYYVFNGGRIEDGKMNLRMSFPIDLYIITTAHKRDTFEWDQEIRNLGLSQDPKINMYKNKVVIDSWNNISKYVNTERAFFIFDEQRVVGTGKWTKAFYKIAKKNTWMLLTATPADKLSDYMPTFIANGFYKNKKDFCENHVIWNPHTPYPSISGYFGTRRLEKYRDDILIVMQFERPTTAHHEYITVNYDRDAYKLVQKDRIVPDEYIVIHGKKFPKPIESVAEFCYTLRKITNEHPERVIAIMEILKKHPKAIIFYNFRFEAEILRTATYPDGTIVAEWNGDRHDPVPTGDRWVYLVQYTAGAEGWNCITTDTMIFYSETYSYRAMVQACGRIDRRNTSYKDLYYYHLRSYSKIDLAIKKALSEKKNFNIKNFAGSCGFDNKGVL